jgi:hypothetical protein
MTDMPTRSDESPPRQQDRADEVFRGTRDEVRNSERDPRRDVGNDDIGEWMDFPDINTDGSER